METEERIANVMSNYCEPIKYSIIRDKFKRKKDFLDRFCFLISTGDIRVLEDSPNKSRYPDEVPRIKAMQEQYGYIQNTFSDQHLPNVTIDDGLPKGMDDGMDPFVFYIPNAPKIKLQ
jgi:hypothetical protein